MTEKQINKLKKIRRFKEGKVVPWFKRLGTAAEGSGLCTWQSLDAVCSLPGNAAPDDV